MTIIIRNAKTRNDSPLTSVETRQPKTTLLPLPSLPIHNSPNREMAMTYRLKCLHIVMPKTATQDMFDFVQTAIENNSHHTGFLKKYIQNTPWVAVVQTNTWLLVYQSGVERPTCYPKGFDIAVDVAEINDDESHTLVATQNSLNYTGRVVFNVHCDVPETMINITT